MEEAIYTVGIDIDAPKRYRLLPRRPATEERAELASFDVAVLEFDDDGRFEDRSQLDRTADWIRHLRDRNSCDDVLVVVFVHGWKHNADWSDADNGDEHFRAFRHVLASLALRELERMHDLKRRRVFGVYIGWNGYPKDSWMATKPIFREMTFWNRYATAARIGGGDDIRTAIQEITNTTKKETHNGSGQLILAGHSMGGLIMESALLDLVRKRDREMMQSLQRSDEGPVTTRIGGEPVLFPDIVLTLNSAADSRKCRELKVLFEQSGVKKSADTEGDSQRVSYSPPLLVSMTSQADLATRVIWRLVRPSRVTVGHDRTLVTHEVSFDANTIRVPRRRGKEEGALQEDFGQNFHVLRRPDPPSGSCTPTMVVDLPDRLRKNMADWPDHRRCRLSPSGQPGKAELVWSFRVPKSVVKNHNDIFNYQSASLILALMQIGGVVGSLAGEWAESFESQDPNPSG